MTRTAISLLCALVILSPTRPPTAAGLSELWVEPERSRDLYHGVGGPQLAPSPMALYKVLEIKKGGFSDGYTVADQKGRKWSAKLYPEARTEVVASRILWGVGYHQPPVYTLDRWSADGARSLNPQPVARFREEEPEFYGLKESGSWSYSDNPFVGTKPLAGLLVLQVMLGNSDLKADNNMLYTLSRPVEGAQAWYVARDLGHTFGRTGVVDAPRDDMDVFDRTPFITGVENGVVTFDYRGLHAELFKNLTVGDVEWICSRLSKISDEQWADAFRAGGYPDPTAQRYIRRMKQKIAEGLALVR